MASRAFLSRCLALRLYWLRACPCLRGLPSRLRLCASSCPRGFLGFAPIVAFAACLASHPLVPSRLAFAACLASRLPLRLSWFRASLPSRLAFGNLGFAPLRALAAFLASRMSLPSQLPSPLWLRASSCPRGFRGSRLRLPSRLTSLHFFLAYAACLRGFLVLAPLRLPSRLAIAAFWVRAFSCPRGFLGFAPTLAFLACLPRNVPRVGREWGRRNSNPATRRPDC